MTRLRFLIITAVIVVLAVVWSRQHETQSMPLVQASDEIGRFDCPKLANPCDTVNCNRVSTKDIA